MTSAPLPDFSKWGEVERQPMRTIRRKTAEHMARAWAHVPHVTQGDKADITTLEELRQKYGKRVEAGRRQADRHGDRAQGASRRR